MLTGLLILAAAFAGGALIAVVAMLAAAWVVDRVLHSNHRDPFPAAEPVAARHRPALGRHRATVLIGASR